MQPKTHPKKVRIPTVDCPICGGWGWTCQEHPTRPMGHCSAPGIPCGTCAPVATVESPDDPSISAPSASQPGCVGNRFGGFVRTHGAKLHRGGLIGPGYSNTQVVQIPICNVFNLGMK